MKEQLTPPKSSSGSAPALIYQSFSNGRMHPLRGLDAIPRQAHYPQQTGYDPQGTSILTQFSIDSDLTHSHQGKWGRKIFDLSRVGLCKKLLRVTLVAQCMIG